MILALMLVALMSSVFCVDAAPSDTNSLVNLGKIDVAFYIDTKPQGLKASSQIKQHLPSSTVADEPCVCLGLASTRNSRPGPDFFSKLLRNNDLVSFNKPTLSPLCCESHEQVRQESILLEMGPQQRLVSDAKFPAAALLDALMSAPSKFPFDARPRQHPIELLIFPNRRDTTKTPELKYNKKEVIKAVGDKEMRNDFRTLKPPQPSSVKKDLTLQEVKDKEDKRDDIKTISNTNLV